MYSLTAVTLFAVLAYVHAGGLGLGVGLAGSVDGSAVISGPSGVVTRSGLASVGPVVGPGLISAGVVPGAVIAGQGLGLGLGGLGLGGLGLGARGLVVNAGLGGLGARGLAINGGLGLGLGINGINAINQPGLVAKALGLEGSGIEGQWVPDINEQLHDDGSYRPGLDH